MLFILPTMTYQADDIQNLTFLWEQQLKQRKRWKILLWAFALLFTVLYIPFAPQIPAPWNSIGLTIATLAVGGLGFLNRISLMHNKMRFGNERKYARLLEFAESEDYKLSPEEALAQMEFRRRDAWRM